MIWKTIFLPKLSWAAHKPFIPNLVKLLTGKEISFPLDRVTGSMPEVLHHLISS